MKWFLVRFKIIKEKYISFCFISNLHQFNKHFGLIKNKTAEFYFLLNFI
ncbi:hypothetical protein LEP1GSC116_4467 [Leptospira interrogans serovar Icterohaemorrhagiae str. Verdun HP]|uniref:Uncharacterized protein n=1 Tax=Leptospira interrogans serovar Icterohaemorrhagiae str. Verdun HP TaxID=1049910 RepID=M6RMX0_LEPIR|nr:hypothetical protein LEP1GSC116_4467 [Leptospira interrogans serovar Icterohaemorrhagiae str. Verdun HP]